MNEKFETLKNQLGTGLIMRAEGEDTKLKSLSYNGVVTTLDCCPPPNINDCTPHLFSMKDLTTPIRVDGYDDGKEFVPVVELMKYRAFDYWELLSNEDEPKDIIVRFRSEDDSTYIDEFAPLVVNFSNVQGIPYWIVNLLIKWHFNVFDLPETDYINALESRVYEPKNQQL